jgi:hypothetical protein
MKVYADNFKWLIVMESLEVTLKELNSYSSKKKLVPN